MWQRFAKPSTVKLEDCKHNENAEIIVEVIDASGNRVVSKVPYRNEDGSFSFVIDVHNHLKPGIYIISGRNSNESYNEKVIIE